MNTTIKIGLTDFIEFVKKPGERKITKVRQIVKRDEYHPSYDFYRNIREKLIEFSKTSRDFKEFTQSIDSFLFEFSESKKISHAKSIVAGYKRFLRKKEFEWFNPPVESWIYNELSIRLNPEIGLEFENKKYLIKLYFKEERLTKQDSNLIIHMLNSNFEDYNVAILDVRRCKLHVGSDIKPNEMDALLKGEATSFINLWSVLNSDHLVEV